MAETKTRVAILASGDRKHGGGGSTADRVARDSLENDLNFEVGLVICNNPLGTVGVHGLFDAINKDFSLRGDRKIPVETIDHSEYPWRPGDPDRGMRLSESQEYCKLLERYNIELVSALGFLLICTGQLIEERGWRPEYGAADPTHNGIYHPNAAIINNHPNIIPYTADTHGAGAHQRAIDLFRKGRITHAAMSWHLMSVGVDNGAIIRERPVRIENDDDASSLGSKMQTEEKDESANVISDHAILRAQHQRYNATR